VINADVDSVQLQNTMILLQIYYYKLVVVSQSCLIGLYYMRISFDVWYACSLATKAPVSQASICWSPLPTDTV